MKERLITAIYPAIQDDIEDLKTFRALPTHHVQHIDPFLFLNHHGPQIYPQNNRGLPFGPHPHRGFETVTFIIEGDIAHKDTGGHSSVINAGGIQWMTAGRGLVHSEESSEEFKKMGGPLEILQLWVNLPARLKMTEPRYLGRQKNEIPHISEDQGKISIDLISGNWNQTKGAVEALFDIHLMLIHFQPDSKLNFAVPENRSLFFYIVRGSLLVNGQNAKAKSLVEFNHHGEELNIKASEPSLLLFGHAHPHQEPIVSYGPFVMNTKDEIQQAIRDYQNGKLR